MLEAEVLKTEEKNSSFYIYLKNVTCKSEAKTFKYHAIILTAKKEAKLKEGALGKKKADDAAGSFNSLTIEDLLPGNRIYADASREGFSSARNQGNYDEAQYFHSLGIEEKFRLTGDLVLTSKRVRPLRAAMIWLRERLKDSVLSLTAETDAALELGANSEADATSEAQNHAGFFLAILTGDKSSLDAETKDLYRKSGIAHILAISGLHISFLGMSLYSFLRKRMRFLFAALLSGTVMIFFCIMSGESASAVRATLMFLVRLLALRFGKSFDLLSALGLSAILLLLFNPMYLYNSGFLLSFGALLGIGLLAPALQKIYSDIRQQMKENKQRKGQLVLIDESRRRSVFSDAVEKLSAALISSLSVTLITLPLIINTYYEIPAFSLLLNLLVIPLMGYVLGSGMFGTLLGLFSLFLGRMLIGAGVYLISLIEFLCALADHIPFSIVITGHMSGWKVLIYYLGITGVLFLGSSGKRKKLKEQTAKKLPAFRNRFSGTRYVLALLFVIIPMILIFHQQGRKQLELSFFDVDQGDGILIESPSGKVYMIDGGSSSVSALYRYRLESTLKYKGIRKIDYVFISHTDTDHISAVLEMLEEDGAGAIRICNLALPYIPDNEHYEELIQAAKEKEIPVLTLKKGVALSDGELSFSCLYPASDYRAADVNNYSAVLSLRYGEFDALFTGDIGEEGEKILLKEGDLKDYELLKVAHHGSKYSSGKAFLEAVLPEAAITSAGTHNSYGHPHPDTIERLKDIGAKSFVTAENGEILVAAGADGQFSVKLLLK